MYNIYVHSYYINFIYFYFRWDNAWQRNSKQQSEQTSLFGTQPGTAFNMQFPPPVTRQRRSNSLTPPVAPSHHLEVVDRSNNINCTTKHKPRSFSVSGDHTS